MFETPGSGTTCIRLRCHDGSRFFGAAFLALWLCGWAVGESVVLYVLVRGAAALVTATPLRAGHAPLQPAPAALAGAFLLAWLALWTFGGFAALGELLRLLWGEDRIELDSGTLRVTWARGPFRTGRTFALDAIRRFTRAGRHDAIVLHTEREHVELTRMGTAGERDDAVAALAAALPQAVAALPAAGPPGDWEVVLTPEGERALVPNEAQRRMLARIVATLALGLAAVTAAVGSGVRNDIGLLAPALICLGFTAGAAWGAWTLARVRDEWRLGSGSLVLRRRSGEAVRDVFEARRLVLDSGSDSDGDVWTDLVALGDADAAPSPAPAWAPGRPRNAKQVARRLNDTGVVRDLATWLAHETGLPLEDRTTREARAADLAAMRAALENSGRLGRWAAKWIDRAGERRTGS